MNGNDNLKDDSSIQILFGLLPLIIDASWSLRSWCGHSVSARYICFLTTPFSSGFYWIRLCLHCERYLLDWSELFTFKLTNHHLIILPFNKTETLTIKSHWRKQIFLFIISDIDIYLSLTHTHIRVYIQTTQQRAYKPKPLYFTFVITQNMDVSIWWSKLVLIRWAVNTDIN